MALMAGSYVRLTDLAFRRLVPFVLILVVLEEILPLIVLYVPGLLPSTCVLPSQSDRIREKAETRRLQALVPLKEWVQRSGKNAQVIAEGGVQAFDSPLLKNVCKYVVLL